MSPNITRTITLAFTLNGEPVSIETDPGRRVLDLLRDTLGLTAAKEGCGSGECGACAVLVDGVARLSCLMLAAQLEGREVVTAEGLGTIENPHPIQASFAAAGAVQCGYCTPGMTVAATEFLARNPSPERGEVREAISGNLCRCTGYVKIVDAVMDAAEVMRDFPSPGDADPCSRGAVMEAAEAMRDRSPEDGGYESSGGPTGLEEAK